MKKVILGLSIAATVFATNVIAAGQGSNQANGGNDRRFPMAMQSQSSSEESKTIQNAMMVLIKENNASGVSFSNTPNANEFASKYAFDSKEIKIVKMSQDDVRVDFSDLKREDRRETSNLTTAEAVKALQSADSKIKAIVFYGMNKEDDAKKFAKALGLTDKSIQQDEKGNVKVILAVASRR